MSQNYFHYKFGEYEGISVRDADEKLNMPELYPKVPVDLFAKLFEKYHITAKDRFDTISLVLRSREHTILFDTGWGKNGPPATGNLLKNLQDAGIDRRKVDIIIHTHAHPDHVGGNADDKGEPNFPNARHYINQVEWDYWNSDPDLTSAGDKAETIRSFVKKNVIGLKKQFQVVKPDVDFLPGFKFILAPGHSAGHSTCLISSGSEKLLCIGDVFHTQLGLMNPEWKMFLDYSPEQAVASRHKILELASSTNLMISAAHLPYPGIGHIVKTKGEYFWKPI